MSQQQFPDNGSLCIAIMSDLHAYEKADGIHAPSHLCISEPESMPSRHPISGLRELIKNEALRANILLCPGDLGDRAKPAAIKYAWEALQTIGAKLNSNLIAATTGNHDVDSRYTSSPYDPKGFLQSLSPVYPISPSDLSDRYWSRHFAIWTDDLYRLIILNSSAFHGGNGSELEHGRISEETLEQLRIALAETSSKPVNILLCHHHPQQHSELKLGDYDVMTDGQLLIDLLGCGKYGEWIIIHGHKHHPKLTYASGSSTSPIVFSAGSLCAYLYPELGTVARNQFYILEFPLHLQRQYGLIGTFRAWDWAFGSGWQPAADRSGLPVIGGFGWRGSIIQKSDSIATVVKGSYIKWSEVRGLVPQVDYILPQDFESLRTSLEVRHGLSILDKQGIPYQIGATQSA